MTGLKAKLIALAGGAAAVAIMALRIFLAGKASERAEQFGKRLKAMRKRKEIEDEIEALDDDDLERRYRRWMR